MFDRIFLILILIFRNSLCQSISEIKFNENASAYIELNFGSQPNCNITNFRLLLIEENTNSSTEPFLFSDVVILDNITTNEHGLVTIGSEQNFTIQHKFNYHSNLLHGLALLKYVKYKEIFSEVVDSLLHSVANKT